MEFTGDYAEFENGVNVEFTRDCGNSRGIMRNWRMASNGICEVLWGIRE